MAPFENMYDLTTDNREFNLNDLINYSSYESESLVTFVILPNLESRPNKLTW